MTGKEVMPLYTPWDVEADLACLPSPAGTAPTGGLGPEQILQADNWLSAQKAVKANKGNPGLDGLTVERLGEYMTRFGAEVELRIMAGRHRWTPFQRGRLRKESRDGVKQWRELAWPAVVDRVLLRAIVQRLGPEIDYRFEHSATASGRGGVHTERCWQRKNSSGTVTGTSWRWTSASSSTESHTGH